jgi:tight adherence protein B
MHHIASPLAAAVSAVLFAFASVRMIGIAADRYGRSVAQIAERGFADVFVFLGARELLRFSLLAVLVVPAALFALTRSAGIVLLAAVVVPLGPQLAWRWLDRRRRRRFVSQLPDAIAALAGSLRAGASLAQALAGLAERQPRPLSQELALVARKQRMGMPLDRALAELVERMPGAELALFVACVRIARELGGNLAESLERLAATLRRKSAIEGKLRALTSQGKIQGVVVGLLPVFLVWVLTLLEPQAMRPLFTTPLGWGVLAVIALLEGAGFLLIRRIVRIEV